MTPAPTTHKGILVILAAVIALSPACGDDPDPAEPDLTVATVSVAPTAPPALESLGETVSLTATAEASGGTTISGKTFTWDSDDKNVATVDANGVVTAVENGTATITATTDGVSGTSSVTVQQVAAELGFRTISDGTVRTTMTAFEVEIQDANGNVVASATNQVTIAIGTNPGNLILHTSGIDDLDRFIELVDHATPVVLTPELSNSEGADELLGLTYRASTGAVLATDRNDDLSSIDLSTGAMTLVGNLNVYVKGLAFDDMGRLIGAVSDEDSIVEIDPATADTTFLGRVTIAGDSVLGFTGLAADPSNGMLYAVVKLRDNINGKTRDLATLDVATLTVTSVATLSEDGIAAIAFLSDGTLLAVTGDGATNAQTLWSVNKGDGTLTQILALGNGADGESIEAIPARLSGTLSAAAVNGVATFNNAVIDGSGMGYTFSATATGLTAGTSAAFNINQ